jgi:hypothetical protein
MAKYLNSSENRAALPGHGLVEAGELALVNKYVYPLPAAFELVDHSGTKPPWYTLYDGTVDDFEQLTGLAKYGTLTITNNTGNVIEVVVNEDNTNVLTILNGATWPIVQDKEIETMDVTGSGEGSFYVYGTL